jgi:DDE superfamily endonuclease
VCPDHAQKNALKPWQHKPWVLPPHANAACVGAREDGLEVDPRPDEPQRPQVGIDETSTPLVAATRAPLPAAPGQPERVADEYERQGTATLFLVFAPLAGQRRVQVTERRTAVDFAPRRQDVVAGQYPQADKLVLVLDHLNTHTLASRYDACAPAEARRLMARLARHDTPTHGRWLHRAETDLSVLATPCLDRRIPHSTPLTQEVAAWERQRNAAQCRVNWRFTTPDARIKLKRRYPSIQLG